MAHIVYITNGMASTLHSSFELTRRLEQAGHRITYVSHADIGKSMSLRGYPFVHLTNDRVFLDRIKQDPPGSLIRWPSWVVRRRRIRAQSAKNNEIERVVKRLDPDLLLIDIECHFAIIATASLGIPTALAIVWFTVFHEAGLPPMHTSLIPRHALTRRMEIPAAWWWLRVTAVLQRCAPPLSRRGLAARLRPISYGTLRYADLKAVAKACGYCLRAETDRTQWLRPFVYKHLPILSYNAWEMEFPHVRRSQVHYVGPMIDQHRQEADLDTASDASWQRYTANRQQPSASHRPLIYCSLGTFWSTDRDFLVRVLKVFVRRTDWDLVLGLGGKMAGDELAPMPSNVVVLDWAPQLKVLQLADCAITHGGITTINECIYFKVPMVVYSTKHVDQNGCAARVAFHQLGVMADKDTDTPEQIERHIEHALKDPIIRQNLAKMQAHLLAYERANTAVRLLEQMLGGDMGCS